MGVWGILGVSFGRYTQTVMYVCACGCGHTRIVHVQIDPDSSSRWDEKNPQIPPNPHIRRAHQNTGSAEAQ